MSDTPLVVAPRGRDVVGAQPLAGAAVFTVVAFAVLGGLPGSAVGIVSVLGLVAGGPLIAFIAGTVALLGVSELAGLSLLPAHLLLTSFLVAGAYRDHGRRAGVLAGAIVVLYVALFRLAASSMATLTQTTAVLVGLATLGSYVIHRYELVVLGLVDE